MKSAVINILAVALAVGTVAAAFLLFNRTPENDGEVRLPARALFRAIDIGDYGPPIENAGDGGRIWAVRARADNKPISENLVSTVQYVLDIPNIIAQSAAEAEKGAEPGFTAALRLDFEEPQDYRGHASPWRASESLYAALSPLKPKSPPRDAARQDKKPIPVSKGARVSYYRTLVENFARRYNLNTSLVMAIIHSESDFSPSLVSNKSAMGLMQLLPSTASGEVHRFLYGRRGQIGFEDLRNPEINIRYGTAYLHILLNRYFANVRNRDAREACAIAAYNMGPNRFLRLYGSTPEQAVEKINNMGEEEFYDDLIKRLPVKETRYYVQKVRRMKNHYSSLP